MSTFLQNWMIRRAMSAPRGDSGDGVELPTIFQRVEFLQGDGAAYIDLGVNNKTTFGCLADVGGEFTSGASNGGVAGIGIRHSLDYRDVTYTAYPRSETEYYNANIGLRDVVKSNYLGSGIGEVEGIPESQMSISSYVGNTDFSFLLFGYHIYNGEVWNIKNGKLYHFQLTDGDTLVMDLWPCYRKRDGEPGLFDLVTRKFFTNANSAGAFTCGPDIASHSRYIVFVDPYVEAVCVNAFSSDGIGVTMEDAEGPYSVVTGGLFKDNTQITSFEELQYFTGFAKTTGTSNRPTYGLCWGCTNLKSVVLPPGFIIDAYNFGFCSSLEYLEAIGELVTYYPDQFVSSNTVGLTMILRSDTPPSNLGSTLLWGTSDISIYVPYSADHSVLAAYVSAFSITGVGSDHIYELNADGTIPS